MNLKQRKIFKICIVLTAILIFTPIISYLIYFGKNDVTNDPILWGVFGDYLGGILNPVFSLASLIVLGYLTYLISEQSNKRNQDLFILEKRMEAYDDLTKHFKEINLVHKKVSQSIIFMNVFEKLDSEKRTEHLFTTLKELAAITSTFTDFYHTLFSFNARYGYLFEYDFSCLEFTALVKETKVISDSYDSIVQKNTRPRTCQYQS